MSYQNARDQFLAFMIREGATLDDARALLRYATTLQRLACAQCNGDWPYDNGQRPVVPCPECEAGTVPSALKGAPKSCPDCRISALARAYVAKNLPGWEMFTQGDPRGAVLQVAPPSYREANATRDIHNKRSYGVPAR